MPIKARHIAACKRHFLLFVFPIAAGLCSSCVTYTATYTDKRCDVNGTVPPDGTISSLRLMNGQSVTFDSTGASAIDSCRGESLGPNVKGKKTTGEWVAIPLDSVLE